MNRIIGGIIGCLFVFGLAAYTGITTKESNDQTSKEFSEQEVYHHYLNLLNSSSLQQQYAIEYITEHWDDSHAILALEVMYLSTDPEVYRKLLKLLEKASGKRFGYDMNAWYKWIWNQPENIPARYGDFKGKLHASIDPAFETYFLGRTEQTTIRLDEIRWGGVIQDGIPPLRYPDMVSVEEAAYLEDHHIVFGISINGDVRAYPKRILAWHEMFVDEVGGIPVAGVYCTLCGTVVLYHTEVGGEVHQLGTSGFLYRSNKLMYDQKTQSLWNTIWGKPVVGPLVGKGISLETLSVVTTSWGEWNSRHPDTKVLSLNTGYNRNYDEGEAYREYFATDELMFNVPALDKRLKNKEEILAIRVPQTDHEPLAISTRFLEKHPIYQHRIGRVSFVVLTDRSGANRVFNSSGITFSAYDQKGTVIDKEGVRWTVTEDGLKAENGKMLERLPYHRAFWFGWFAAYPNTRLIK